MKLSNERLDVIESLAAYFGFDPKTPETAPRSITSKQLIEWESNCTNPEGFRQLKSDTKCHINKTLPLNTKGVRGTVLRFPQWMREFTISRGHFDLTKILALYNEATTVAAKK